MKSRGAGIIFAVDVGGVSDTDFFDFGDEISGWWMVWNKWNPMKRKPKVRGINHLLANEAPFCLPRPAMTISGDNVWRRKKI